MKTTLDIPDQIFRKAKSKAAERGESLKQFVTDALSEKLASGDPAVGEPAWMQGFGSSADVTAKPRAFRLESTRHSRRSKSRTGNDRRHHALSALVDGAAGVGKFCDGSLGPRSRSLSWVNSVTVSRRRGIGSLARPGSTPISGVSRCSISRPKRRWRTRRCDRT